MQKITELSQLDLNGVYSYADYLTWQFDETVELIKGKIMLMCPAPTTKHQAISRDLSFYMTGFLHTQKNCQLFTAPFDVKLYNRTKSQLADKEVFTVVQPDLCVICNPEKLTEKGCDGAPDWIIEILSKGNTKKEMQLKYELYEESGVTEYWLVYPYEQVVHQFVLHKESQKYQLLGMYADDEIIIPSLFPKLNIDLAKIFIA